MSCSRSRAAVTTRSSNDHPLWRRCATRMASIWPSEQQINTWANHLMVIFCFGAPYLKEVRRPSLFLLLILFLMRGHYVRHLAASLRDPVILAFSLYFALHVIWLLGSDDLRYGIKIVHVADYLLYPLLFSTLIDRRFIPRMMGALALGLAVGVFWGLGIYFGILPPHPHGIAPWGVPSSPSPVTNPLPWAFMLSVSAVLFVLYMLKFREQPLLMLPLAMMTIFTLLTLFINPQRTGWILGVVLLFVMILMKSDKRRLWHAAVYLLAAGSLALLAYQENSVFRQHVEASISELHALFDNGQFSGSIGWRAGVVKYGIEAAKGHWLLGHGTGDHIKPIKQAWLQSEPDPELDVDFLGHPHQEFIGALVQFGIVGVLLFLNIIFQLARYPGRDNETRIAFRVLALAIGMYSFVNLFVMRSGATLFAVVIVALGLREYWVANSEFIPMHGKHLAGYTIAGALLYAVSML